MQFAATPREKVGFPSSVVPVTSVTPVTPVTPVLKALTGPSAVTNLDARGRKLAEDPRASRTGDCDDIARLAIEEQPA